MGVKDLADLLLDAVQGIEGAQRLLEDHGDAVSPDAAHRLAGSADEFHAACALAVAVEHDTAAGMTGRLVRQELKHREGRDGLSRTAFPDEPYRLSPADTE